MKYHKYYYLQVLTGTYKLFIIVLVHIERKYRKKKAPYAGNIYYMYPYTVTLLHIAPELNSPIVRTRFNHASQALIYQIVGGFTCHVLDIPSPVRILVSLVSGGAVNRLMTQPRTLVH